MADRKAPEYDFPAGATIADLNRASAYAFVCCPCGHEKPIFFNTLMNSKRFGPHATVEQLRMSLKCQRCRRAGADIRLPGSAPRVSRAAEPPATAVVTLLPVRRAHRDSPQAWVEWEKQRPKPTPGARLPWHMATALYREACARDVAFALEAVREGRPWNREMVDKAVAGLTRYSDTLSQHQAETVSAWLQRTQA